jgi:hypothetical protein
LIASFGGNDAFFTRDALFPFSLYMLPLTVSIPPVRLLTCANKITVLYPLGAVYTLAMLVLRFAVTVLKLFNTVAMLIP